MYYLSTSCLVLFFLFSLFHHLPCALSKGFCEDLFQCGNITAGFPFWGGNRFKDCGHPLLELHCFNTTTSLTISDHVYQVLQIDHTSSTLSLATTDFLEAFCSSTFTNTTLPPEIFDLSPTYKSITFYHCNDVHPDLSSYRCPETGPILVSANPEYHHESCHASFTVNVPTSFDTKEKKVNVTNLKSILKKGFEVKVKIDMKACPGCLSSYGFCGFNKSMPLDVKCIPPEPPTAEELHRRCRQSFTCGNQNDLFYPFWIPGREGCGHPDFELDCSGGFAEVSISSVKFRILAANYESGIIRLARVDYINSLCPLNPPNVPFNENVLSFAPETETLTIFSDCRQDFSQYVSTNVKDFDCEDDDTRNYYVTRNLLSPPLQGLRGLFDEFRGSCNRNVSIPASKTALSTLESDPSTDNLKKALEDGFELGVNLDCRRCMDSRGACGYNQTIPSVGFVCYCIDGAHNGTCRNKDAGLSKGVIAVIARGASVLGLAMLILAGWFCLLRRRRKTQEAQYTSKDLPITKEVACLLCVINRKTKTSAALSEEYLKALIPLKQYSYVQVKRITKSFTEVVGKGGFGTVYRGTLTDGRSVAVKILKDSKGNGEDFINEVASMSKTSHVNIVSLLGFCSEGSKRAIIYEYLENGSLDQFISSNTSINVDWMALYGIALGVARGLDYLHHGCKTRIVHFDIKPQNILLDDNLCPKVSDFGLAKLCKKKESILSLLDTRGTIGYIAPEVFSRMYGRVSHKSDVYSYGMLLLEMIGARNKERFDQNSASNISSMYFPEWIYKDLEKGDSGKLIENGISSEDAEVTKKMTIVGLWCIQPFPSDRPEMNRVVEMMEGNLDALEVPPRPVLQNPPVPLQESSTFSEDISIYPEV